MTNEELSNEDLLKLFKQASQELIGGGGRARSWYYELEEEVLSRMEGCKHGDLVFVGRTTPGNLYYCMECEEYVKEGELNGSQRSLSIGRSRNDG